jgi:hypothetical protein
MYGTAQHQFNWWLIQGDNSIFFGLSGIVAASLSPALSRGRQNMSRRGKGTMESITVELIGIPICESRTSLRLGG